MKELASSFHPQCPQILPSSKHSVYQLKQGKYKEMKLSNHHTLNKTVSKFLLLIVSTFQPDLKITSKEVSKHAEVALNKFSFPKMALYL